MIKFFTELHLGGIVLRDPATSLTNILIFLAGWVCFRRLRNTAEDHVRSWRIFFLFLGLAALVGVIVHGFSFYTPEKIHFWIWVAMGLIQNIGISFAQLATPRFYFPAQYKWIRALVALQFIALAILFIALGTYEAVKVHVALGLMPVMVWNFYRASRGEKHAAWISFGILVSASSAIVHTFKLSFSPWFNYNDIAHVFIVISLLMIGKGVRLLNARAGK
jgi:hypothetical protein